MELLAVRPDMFDPGGLARALRGILEVETGPATYEILEPLHTVRVDPSVRDERSFRPHIACAVIESITLDDDRIKILMKLQENLHWALGRDRKHASIGVYDLDSFASTELEYTTEPPDYAFRPLGGATSSTLANILSEHPKGRAYAHLLAGFDRYPILRTRDGRVLSMPPVINSEETKVHQGTRGLFIDVTGPSARVVDRALNILATSLLELDLGARLRGVKFVAAVERVTPDLTVQRVKLSVEKTGRLLGLDLDTASVEMLLRKMRHGISTSSDAASLEVLVPAYRNDILHERDLMEDVAIAYGYDRIPRTLVPTMTVGRELPIEARSNRAREVLVGLGFLEVMSLVLESPESSAQLLGLPDHPESVLLENPISVDQTQLRTSLLPGLLETFARNRHHALPQSIFEVSDVTFLESTTETGAREERHVSLAQIAPKVGFAEIRAWGEALVRELGWPLALRPTQGAEAPFLTPGRGAWVVAPDGSIAGILGEVAPTTLDRLGLGNPVVVAEFALPGADGGPDATALRSFSPLR